MSVVENIGKCNLCMHRHIYKYINEQINIYRVCEHLSTDKNSHIFKHLQSSKPYRDACRESCFKIIDPATSYHQLKIKEALHILREGPDLNKQV